MHNLHFEHAHGHLEECGGALVEEQVPESEENLHMYHTGKQGKKPV